MAFEEVNIHLHFDIHASIVFQLGESLISNVNQALLEVVKNAYDADSTYANIIIETRNKLIEDTFYGSRVRSFVDDGPYLNAKGYVIIEDAGIGMDLQTIKEGWLLISNPLKRDFKQRKEVTKKGRTPLGDKGVGRLGVQRLGYNVEILTKTASSPVGYYVAFSWRDFLEAQELTKVPVKVETITSPLLKTGTIIIVSDLRDVATWTGERAIAKLETDLSQLISPYQELGTFYVTMKIDDIRINLAQIVARVLDTAYLRYNLEFDTKKLIIKGKTRLEYFRPGEKRRLEIFNKKIENDRGEGLFSFLASQNDKKKLFSTFKKSSGNKWFIEYEQEIDFLDTDKLKESSSEIANPGPFKGEIDFFNLDSSEWQNVFNRVSEYKNYIKNLSGIRVYRDGFGISVARDWLGLSSAGTSGLSSYSLKPENTLGYIALTAKDNAVLEETTDREGFKITPYYENFFLLLQRFVKFTERAQEFVRRGSLEFLEKYEREIAHIEEAVTPEKLSARLVQNISSTGASLHEAKKDLEEIAGNTETMLVSMESMIPKNTLQNWYAQESTKAIKQTIEQTKITVDRVENSLSRFSHLEAESHVLQSQIERLREQLSQAYETVSLGLTAEALSHEINAITNQMAERNRQIVLYLNTKSIKDPQLLSFTEYINSSVIALRKQLSHLAPSLRYVREKRVNIQISDFLREIRDYYSLRFQKRDIKLIIRESGLGSFEIFMNKGKFTQIIDNLLLNSEYWLRESLRLKYIVEGIITIEVMRPFLRISDNGRGIEQSVEGMLFEPFVTAKNKDEGRGLGLFIVQQLLDTEACSIRLLPQRNQYGCLYIFEIDLAGGVK